MMKRVLVIAFAMFMSLTLFAQKKGDRFVGVGISASAGKIYVESDYDEIISQPLNSSFYLGGELGFFPKDNLKLALALGMGYSTTPIGEVDGEWIKLRGIGLNVNPNISYYVELVKNRFYYAPELGFSIEAGTLKERTFIDEPHIDGYFAWQCYLSFIGFEFRATRDFAMGISVGSLNYTSLKELQCDITTSQFTFKLNQAALYAKFYF